jgi:hypothetical protein
LALTENADPSEATNAPIVSVSGLTNEFAELPPTTTELLNGSLELAGVGPVIIDCEKELARASVLSNPSDKTIKATVICVHRERVMGVTSIGLPGDRMRGIDAKALPNGTVFV